MSGLQILKSNSYRSPQDQELFNIKDPINSGLQQNSLNKSIVIDRERGYSPSNLSQRYSYEGLPAVDQVGFQVKNLPQSDLRSASSGILAADISNSVRSTFQTQQLSTFPTSDANLISSYPKYPYYSHISNYEENPNKEKQQSYIYPTSTDIYQNQNETYFDNGYKNYVNPTNYIPASSTINSQYFQKEMESPSVSNYYDGYTLQKNFLESEKSTSYPTKTSTFVKPSDSIYTTSYVIQTPMQYTTVPSTTTIYPSLSQRIMPQYMPSQSSHQYSYEQSIQYHPQIQTNSNTNFPSQLKFSPKSSSVTSLNNPLWVPTYFAQPQQSESNLIL